MSSHRFEVAGVLLDIEGTVAPIAFVHDVMFPYVREHAADYLETKWSDPKCQEACQEACEQLVLDPEPQTADSVEWASDPAERRQQLLAKVHRLMDADAKATGLKMLQGLIWQSGFASGELKSELFPDVQPVLQAWLEAGVDMRIYSSGSVTAQRLFFGNTESGNLLSLFSGHYDTTIGGKKEAASYTNIVSDWQLPAEQILFLSDIPAELEAAAAAGMQVGLAVRPGNAVVETLHNHPEFRSLAEVDVRLV